MRLLIAITGASGTIYAQRLLDQLDPRQHEVHVMLSQYAPQVVEAEQPGGLRLPEGFQVHNHRSMNLPFASGSNPPDVMVVIPCSMGTVGRIAHGLSSDAMLRCADVMLKERRRLVLMVRETPFNLAHLRNMTSVTEMGGIVYPPLPALYQKPQSIEDMVDHTTGRVLDLFGIQQTLAPQWQGIKLQRAES
jgi:4-hydroxy-3-polyprenylbenzoate decarboxylase